MQATVSGAQTALAGNFLAGLTFTFHWSERFAREFRRVQLKPETSCILLQYYVSWLCGM